MQSKTGNCHNFVFHRYWSLDSSNWLGKESSVFRDGWAPLHISDNSHVYCTVAAQWTSKREMANHSTKEPKATYPLRCSELLPFIEI